MNTSAHTSDDLPRLLTGEATRAEVMSAAEHLRGCPDCQQELVSAVVAHASLTSAHRFAPDIVAPPSASASDRAPADALPDLSGLFAKVREDASAPPAHRRLPRGRMLVAAAAVVAAAAAGVTVAETVGSGSSQRVAAQAVQLNPVGTTGAAASARISGGRMRIDAAALPSLDSARQYEVWLADSSGSRLRPLGYLGTDRTADLAVPASVMAGYGYIAISIQKTSQVQFSGDLVARGQYA